MSLELLLLETGCLVALGCFEEALALLHDVSVDDQSSSAQGRRFTMATPMQPKPADGSVNIASIAASVAGDTMKMKRAFSDEKGAELAHKLSCEEDTQAHLLDAMVRLFMWRLFMCSHSVGDCYWCTLGSLQY